LAQEQAGEAADDHKRGIYNSANHQGIIR
jgi:hypothetical protein